MATLAPRYPEPFYTTRYAHWAWFMAVLQRWICRHRSSVPVAARAQPTTAARLITAATRPAHDD
jgi:hypothetical protein